MLYFIQANVDRQALNQSGEAQTASAAEGARAREVFAEGRLLGLWRRVDCKGSIFIIEAESHEALRTELEALPMFPYFGSFDVIPITPHPAMPEFASYGARES